MASNHQRYFFVLFSVLVAFVAFLVVKPFIKAIVTGMLLAYVVNPVFKKSERLIKNRSVRALLISVLVLLVILIPVVLVIQASAPEARYLYLRSKQLIAAGDVLFEDCDATGGALCTVFSPVRSILSDPQLRIQLQNLIAKAATAVIDRGSDFFLSLPSVILQVFVTFFSLFYFLKDGAFFVDKMKNLLPVKEKYIKRVVKRVRSVLKATIFGSLLVALIQGVIAYIGYVIFGLPSAIIWGMFTAFFALIPVLGTSLVWLPASLVLIISGAADGAGEVWKGVGLLIYGALVVSTVDNFIRPKLIGQQARVHPILVLVGALGGLIAFGIVGFFVGPVILALVSTMIDIYEQEKEIFKTI